MFGPQNQPVEPAGHRTGKDGKTTAGPGEI
jgi:hypothetical protein